MKNIINLFGQETWTDLNEIERVKRNLISHIAHGENVVK